MLLDRVSFQQQNHIFNIVTITASGKQKHVGYAHKGISPKEIQSLCQVRSAPSIMGIFEVTEFNEPSLNLRQDSQRFFLRLCTWKRGKFYLLLPAMENS